MADHDVGVAPLETWKSVDAQAQWIAIDSLGPADSPRLDGEDIEHTRMLAESGAKLPERRDKPAWRRR